jgi:hypothetical protein
VCASKPTSWGWSAPRVSRWRLSSAPRGAGMVLGLILWCSSPSSAPGQLPASCVSALTREVPLAWNLGSGDDPFLNGMPERLIRVLRETSDSPEPASPDARDRINSLVSEEAVKSPVAVEHALAVLIANDGSGGLASYGEATLLADVYRELSGRAEPILRILQLEGADRRIPVALRSIRPPLDSASENRILAIACTQAGIAMAVARDSSTRKVLAGRSSIMLTVPGVVQHSVHLTTGERRAALESLRTVLDTLLAR